MKIHPWGAELFRAGGQIDGQTDLMKLTVSFLNILSAPKGLC